MSKKTFIFLVLLAMLYIGSMGIGSIMHVNAQVIQSETLPDKLVWVSPFNRVVATITDQARVQAFYEELYALPRIAPPSPYRLAHEGVGPVSFRYTLQFFVQGHLLKQVDLQTIAFNGLELNPHDYRQYTSHFWSIFAQTFHEHKMLHIM